ncbi:MAG: NAD(P)/FAD-dependent oxidoreductase [Nitrospirae bacterium]|nr:NAD(P)/FAD-dependent oxidoreductase [Nitrospirota bacterium]
MKYVIIGNGVAGTAAAANIRKLDSSGEITVLTDEAVPFYSRIRLIDYLAKEAGEQDIVIYKDDWYKKNNIKLLLSTPVTGIDKDNKQVITAAGAAWPYDRVLIASGGISFIPPIPGSNKKGVFALRTIADANEILKYADSVKKVVLIGGGVLGLEAGNSLRKTGHEISVVEFFPRLLPRQMDPEGAQVLKAQMESMGFIFYLGARSKEIYGEDKAAGLLLEDGTRVDGDLIIVSAGVRPQAELAKKLGLPVNKGVVVNDRMETETKDIYAAGDLIEHRGMFYGIWPAAQKQGEIAGINMAGGNAVYEGTTMSNVLKVVGIDLAAAGDIDADGKSESIIQKDQVKYIYRKLVIKDNVITGCILYGDISGYRKVLKAIDDKRNIQDIRKDLERWDLSRV